MLDFDLHLKFATILFNYKHILITNYLGCPRIIDVIPGIQYRRNVACGVPMF